MNASLPVPAGRSAIHELVARHPLAAFIVLAYMLSGAWLLNYGIDLGATNGFGIIGSASPALAALIIATLLKPGPSGIPAAKRWRLFGIVGILALAVLVGLRLWFATGLVTVSSLPAAAPYPSAAAFVMDVVAAAVVAFVLSGVYSPRQGVRDLLRSLDPRYQRVRWYWWAMAAGLYPAVLALSNAASAAAGLPAPAPIASGEWYWLAASAVIVFLYCLIGGGGLEEPGWRGFALPLLQAQYSPLRASLILAVVWTLWHWFLAPQAGLLAVVFLLLTVAPLAILFTAVYNRTGGSLPVAILLHASINTTDLFLPASTLATALWLLLILAIALWMWRSPRTFAYADKAEAIKEEAHEQVHNH